MGVFMALLRQAFLFSVTVFGTLVYLLVSRVRSAMTIMRPWQWQRKKIEEEMLLAPSLREWTQKAEQLDRINGLEQWRKSSKPPTCDLHALTERMHRLREARLAGDHEGARVLLRESLVRGLAGSGNPALYNTSVVGTKHRIEEFVEEMVKTIEYLAQSQLPGMQPSEQEQFLADARQAYGRSALVLSGGASLGMLHWGVVRCLFEEQVLPLVLCGSSIGALVVAILGIHTDNELNSLLRDPNAIDFAAFETLGSGSGQRKVKRFLKHGVLLDIHTLEAFCLDNLQDLTFLEAYNRTGRIINITLPLTDLTRGLPGLLNHLTTPNVLLRSAASASCAQPGLYAPVALLAKDVYGDIVRIVSHSETTVYVDIGASDDLPRSRLSEQWNVNHVIVSQVQPHVLPFLRSRRSSSRFHLLHQLGVMIGLEVQHMLSQAFTLGWLPSSFSWLHADLIREHEGDVTIVPNLSAQVLRKAFSNPNTESFAWFADVGEASSYPYVAALRTKCAVEHALHRCLRRIRAKGGISDRTVTTPQRPRAKSIGRCATPTTADHIPSKRRTPPPRVSSTPGSPRSTTFRSLDDASELLPMSGDPAMGLPGASGTVPLAERFLANGPGILAPKPKPRPLGSPDKDLVSTVD